MDVEVTDNSDAFRQAKDEAVNRALETIGIKAEAHAKSVITEESRVDTGLLRNSISHMVAGETVYIGTNVPYAVYNEIGTGIYLDPAYGTGRQTPWVYLDAKGVARRTVGMKPIHFLKRAVTEHMEEYKEIARAALKK